MKILFLSSHGSSHPLGTEMMMEGHEVKMYIREKKDRKIGDGFIPKTDDWQNELEWAELVVCDDCGWGKENDAIRRLGIPVLGGTELSDALEEKRGVGQKMFKALGMNVLPSKQFAKISEAIAYVRANPKCYVVKVDGKAQNDKTLTYVGEAEDGSDIEPVLMHMEQKKGIKVEAVHLQDRKQGIEVAIGGFFNGRDFLDPVFVNFEHKKLMPSDTEQAGIGPATGEMGTAGVWKDKGFKLYREVLERFAPVLAEEGYRGYFDVNCIVSWESVETSEGVAAIEQVVWPLEMTNRFGWPTILLQMQTMKINDLGELFHGIASGQVSDFKVSDTHSLCVVIGAPPLPYVSQDLADDYSRDMPVMFRGPEREGIYPGDVYCGKGGRWQMTGDMGYPVVCAAGADSIEEARNRAYALVRNVIVPNRMYRIDIGERITGHLASLSGLLQFEHERV